MRSTLSSSDMQNVADMANISVTKIWQIQETFIFIVMLQFESKTFNDIFLHFSSYSHFTLNNNISELTVFDP